MTEQAPDIIDKFISGTRKKRDLESDLRTVNGELAKLEDAIIEQFISDGTSKVTRHRMTVYLNQITSVKAKGGDTAALRRALEQAGLQDLIGPSMARVKSWVKERADESEPIPDAVANAMEIQTISKVGAREGSS